MLSSSLHPPPSFPFISPQPPPPSIQFETETEDNKSRLDLTKSMGIAADNRSKQEGNLFTGEDEKFAFARAVSRLHEMQTPAYYGGYGGAMGNVQSGVGVALQ